MARIGLDVSKEGGSKHRSTANLSIGGIGGVLASTPIFKHVAPDKLEEVARSSYLRRYAAGDTVILQGDYGHSMFVLLYGSVTISATTDHGQELTLATLEEAGTFFGELALLGRARRNATVRANSESALIELEKTRVEKLDKDVGGVFETIETLSARRSILTFLTNHRYFADLPAAEAQKLADLGDMRVHERGSTIFKEGDAADEVLIVKKGVAKLVQIQEKSEAVLSYFNAGDVVGLRAPWQWPATLLSMGYVEVIAFPRKPFKDVEERFQTVFERFHKDQLDKLKSQTKIGKSETMAIFLDAIVAEGAHEGLSLLTIDLNLCIRCGNCTRSCQARHGHAKMTRRGKKLVRRQKMEVKGEYQTILVPTSCRHCVNPECMIGCPTGAIHRTPEGEVDIHAFCIGCASCANRCPWHNITMVPTPGRMVDGGEMKQIASKCNLCSGYAYSNCVHNCPTGAILRVEPTSYYEELRAVFGDAHQEKIGGGRTKDRAASDASKYGVPAVSVLLGLLMVGMFVSNVSGYSPWSTGGMILGGLSLFCMVTTLGLAVRRRFNRFKVQFGMLKFWARVHFWMGGLMLLAVLLHSGFSPGGLVTSLLLVFLLGSFATGIFGVLYYRWLPAAITRIEGESQVEEDLLEERSALALRRQELMGEFGPHIKGVVGRMRGLVGGAFKRLSASYDAAAIKGRAIESLGSALGELGPEHRRVVEQLLDDATRAQEVRAALWTYGIRRAFLVLHIALTTMLATMTLVHVLTVLFFWTR